MLGVLAFGLLFTSTFLRSPSTRSRVATPLGLSIAIGGAGLILMQAYIGHFCSLCMAVDTCALLIGAGTLMLRRGGWEKATIEEESSQGLSDPLGLMSEGQRVKGVWRDDSQIYDAPNPLIRPSPSPPFKLQLRSWVLLAAVVVGAPVFYPLVVRTSEVPAVIRGMYASDRFTVLEFFDFQCPHCQHLSPRLARLVAEEPGFVLKYGYTPLPGHPGSRQAARIAICAGEQGKEKEVVRRFFEVLDFSPEATLEMAEQIVPDAPKLAACLDSKRPDERIASDTDNLKRAGFVGLPTTYVGGIRILGADEDLVYRDAMRRVREGSDTKGLNPKIYWVGVLLLLVAIVLMGRPTSEASSSVVGRRA